ncbi:MAG TPA: phosphoribosyltransferase family protein [Candidatus Acidoferrum sp.]
MSKASMIRYTAARIAGRVKALGREITRASHGRRLDVVVTMDRGFMFAADLVRAIDAPIALHFLREDVRDVDQGGNERREVFFGGRNTVNASKERPELKGRDVLLVDAVLDSGITQDFLLRRMGESHPRSLRLAVLLDKTSKRRVSLEPDYFGFRTASNEVWTGYGLPGTNGIGRGRKHLEGGTPSKKSRKRLGKKK